MIEVADELRTKVATACRILGMLGMVREHAGARPDAAPALKELLGKLVRKLDYAEYGGAPLLGLHGAYIIGHGRSDARAVTNAIRVAREYVAGGVDGKIADDLANGPVGE